MAAVLGHINDAIGATWHLDARFDNGLLDGAWRIRQGSTVAVLKWHPPTSPAPYNPDAPAVVEYLRSAGYPTPAWLAAGTTPDDVTWWVQELVQGEPLRELDVTSAETFLDLVRLHRDLTPPTTKSWNPYTRALAFGDHASCRRLTAAGGEAAVLVEECHALASPFEATQLTDTELVHSDLNVSNVLVRDGGVATVVDIDCSGRGCAVYDLLSPAVNGVSWDSDRAAIDRLVHYGLETYGPGAVAIGAACLTIETADWYLTADPRGIAPRLTRHRGWIRDLRSRLS